MQTPLGELTVLPQTPYSWVLLLRERKGNGMGREGTGREKGGRGERLGEGRREGQQVVLKLF